MIKKESRKEMREIRHDRVRSKVSGTPEVPRLAVYRSNKNYINIIINKNS